MFYNKKIRMFVAALCAVMILAFSVMSPLAASFSINNAVDARTKALNSYLSSNKIVSMLSSKDAESAESSDIVTYSSEYVTEAVNYSTVKRLNESLDAGEMVVVREGAEGEKVVKYNVKYENGVEVSREAVSSVITKEPVIKIVEYGAEKAAAVSEDSSEAPKLNYSYYIDCEATAYDLSPEENGGYAGQSATGVPLDKGVIAVDPKVIPLGTRVYIEAIDGSWSYGYAVAADTGGAIKGKRVDLCYRTRSECIQFGRKPCRVYILK